MEDARDEPGHPTRPPAAAILRGEGREGLGPSIWRASAWGLLGAYPYQNSIRKRDLDVKDYCISSIFIIKSGKV